MRKFLAVLAMAAMTAFAAPAFAAVNPFMDVPQGHWSYDAVGLLASRGIVSGYPDGAFKGGQPATRYEMASIVARALVTVDAEKAGKQDMELLKKLVMEFKDELDALGVRVDSLDKRVGVLEERLGGWQVNGQVWFDAQFASNNDQNENSYSGDGASKNQFGFSFARFMLTKYIDENTFFFARFNSDSFSGDLKGWYADRFYVQMKLPWDVTFTLGRQVSDWEGDAELYHSIMGEPEGGVWKDQTYDGFNFQKSFGMLDAEVLVGRNDDMITDSYSSATEGLFSDPDKTGNTNSFMEYGLKLQANFSENFHLGVMGLYFDADNIDDLTNVDPAYSGIIAGDALDVQQYGAYFGYSFTPAIALRGYFYWQNLDDGWRVADDSPTTWSALLDVKQDLLKFTSLWVQYIEQDNSFIGPRAANQYPTIASPGLDGPVGADGTNKTWLITAEQQWNDKWSSFLQYVTTDWDSSAYDDTDQYSIGIGYQYSPAIKFWLAYNYIDYGDRTDGGYTGNESVVLFRTAIDF
ncbi:S-layer homology domain-containing protein [Cloacibacillus sp. An23]|uniref:S-layer homology domain-containing protein n=1 Tax=Cloacibacillus sp. An23 TaxID=1965591 RepID=UPI000B38D037|nr:S-layer homology domain-containing protein [Cloacibacillus sp. An23]OUO90804.1 hypothetical protein B5F39_13700 [Cloacibacillus sp. An23]